MVKYVTLYLLLLALTVSAQVNVENDSIIIWNQDRKITWDDFNGNEATKKVFKYDEAEAGISLTISVFPKKLNCLNVEKANFLAIMNKNSSWVEVKTSSGLNHEQTHFDIAEVYARKIRKEIEAFLYEKEECDLQGIADIYYRLESEHWQTQFLYDEEVRICDNLPPELCHNLKKQQEWDNKIAALLEKYKEYELLIDIDDLDLNELPTPSLESEQTSQQDNSD